MRGNAQTVKERIDIVDTIGGYIKLEKAGANFKARCPFHNEKTASFHISPSRQTYYCFGCGKKGDVFTFVEEMEGTDFKGALNLLADKAGVELEYAPRENRDERDRLFEILDEATKFFEGELEHSRDALAYLESRGITSDSIHRFRIGYARDEWRELRTYLLGKGFSDDELLKAGLVKKNEEKVSEAYDVFRGRIIFPLADASGRIIAFSGRALAVDAVPKYLNSPDTILFSKSEVLYGLDKAKDTIRKKNYAILVEGQMDLVLSHQAGVENTVASSGTAFTNAHLSRLKRLSSRIVLAFDGDNAGEKAAEKSTVLGLSLGMEVKVAELPEGKDPADLVRESPELWKDLLRRSVMAIDFFLDRLIKNEKDPRKLGKEIERKILPLVALVESAIERAHFISGIAKRIGIREEVLWEDLKRSKISPIAFRDVSPGTESVDESEVISYKTKIEEKLAEVRAWQAEMGSSPDDLENLRQEERELEANLAQETLKARLAELLMKLARAQSLKENEEENRLATDINAVHREMEKLEESRKVLYNKE